MQIQKPGIHGIHRPCANRHQCEQLKVTERDESHAFAMAVFGCLPSYKPPIFRAVKPFFKKC